MTESECLLDFISRSPTAFHAAASICARLTEAGYVPLPEGEAWRLAPGGRYFVTRNQSSVIAFRLPQADAASFMMVAAHSDSPCFKLKENAESEAAGFYTRLNTERYGGMLMATWMDRPLSVAGRLVVRENGRIVSRLTDAGRTVAMIPNVAIHMMRGANDNMSYNANVDLFPIVGGKDAKGVLRRLLADEAGVEEADILAADLLLYSREPGYVWGVRDEFVSSPRLDDLQCAFSALEGFLAAGDSAAIPLLAVLDNEEVGSHTKQGAASTFLPDVLSRICEARGADRRQAAAASFLVSADNAHAVHPNHPELSDAHHRPRLNGGVVIKHNASQKYTTDAVSEAIFASVCGAAGVPVQYFANRSDMAGGSTLGNIANTQFSLNTVDIGLAQLAMHSAFETAGAEDTAYMIRALTRFYSSSLAAEADGVYALR